MVFPYSVGGLHKIMQSTLLRESNEDVFVRELKGRHISIETVARVMQ